VRIGDGGAPFEFSVHQPPRPVRGSGIDAHTTLPAGDCTMRRSLYACALLVSGALLSGCSDSTFVDDQLGCDEVRSFSVGSTTSGRLSINDCQLQDGSAVDYYRVSISGSRNVHLLLTSDVIDPYVVVMDRYGNVVADEDNGGTGFSELLTSLPSGTYYIAATSYSPGAYGDYFLETQYE
jgi:hypothetical protein